MLSVIGGALVAASAVGLARELYRKKRSLEDYLNHWWLIGKTGHFKSTYIREELVIPFKRDYPNASIVIFETKDEDTINSLLDSIPEEFHEKVLVFAPTDMLRAGKWIGLNLLQKEGIFPSEQVLLTNELIACFERAFGDSIKSNSKDILRNGANSVLEVLPQASILEVYKMFSDYIGTPEETRNRSRGLVAERDPNPFRTRILEKLVSPFLRNYFTTNFILPTIRTMDIYNPIYNKLRAVLNDQIVSRILCQRQGISLRKLVDDGWIIVFFFPKGELGPETSRILSSMAFSKLQLSIQTRYSMTKEERFARPVMVVADEFQDYCSNNTSFNEFLTQARAYGCGLVLAQQHIHQQDNRALHRAIMGNVGNIVMGRVGCEDSELLSSIVYDQKKDFESQPFPPPFFQNLEKLVVVEKLTSQGRVTKPMVRRIGSFTTLGDYHQQLRLNSLEKFGRRVDEIDRDIERRLTATDLSVYV